MAIRLPLYGVNRAWRGRRKGGGVGALVKVLYGEAPPRGPHPYPFIYHFGLKRYAFRILSKKKLYPFHVPTERLLKFSLENRLKHLDESAVVYTCRDILLSVRPQKTPSVGHQGTFPHLAVLAVASLPEFGTGCVFSRACHWLNAFLRFSLYVCFPALGPNWKFYRTLHCTGCVFSRAFHRVHVSFPRLPLAICFPSFAAPVCGGMFSSA